jgi:hypothetical protein
MRQAFCVLSPTGPVVGCEVFATRDLEKPPTLELIARAQHLHNCHDFHDLRRLAKRRLPAQIFDYIDGASQREANTVILESDRRLVQ